MLGPSVIINLWQWFHQHSVKVLVLFIEQVEGKKRIKQFFPKYSLLLSSRLLSNTVHSQLKTTVWPVPEDIDPTCVYEDWIQCPTSKQLLITLRCSGPFLALRKFWAGEVGGHKKTGPVP